MALTELERSKVEEQVEYVEDLLDTAEDAGYVQRFAEYLAPVLQLADFAFGNFSDYAIDKNNRTARGIFEEWSTLRVSWLERGLDNTGRVYRLADWQSLGNALASQLGDAGWKGRFDASPVAAALIRAPLQDVADVVALPGKAVDAAEDAYEWLKKKKKEIEQPWDFSTKLLWGLGLGAVGLTAVGLTWGWLPRMMATSLTSSRQE